jgi:pimeloyl-ACP methyl ester carboxylesterase
MASFDIVTTEELPVWLFYPSKNEDTSTWKEYFDAVTLDQLSTSTSAKTEDYMTEYFQRYIFKESVNISNIENTRINAVRGAYSYKKKWPLVVYAPGYRGLPFENSLVCEMLAAEGYLVAAIPALGVKQQTDSLGLEIQIRYIQQTIQGLIAKKCVDTNRIAVIGFSWGGLSAIIASMRNKDIKSVVSLDGSIRFFYSLAEKMPGFSPTDYDRSTLLFAAEGNDDVDYKFFGRLTKAPAFLVKMKDFNHLDFMSYRFLKTPYQNQKKSLEYTKMIESVKLFLNASLNNRPIDAKELTQKMQPNLVFSNYK